MHQNQIGKWRAIGAFAAAVLAALPTLSSAATSTWDGSTSSEFGYFGEPDNWSPVGVPANNGSANLIFGTVNTNGYTPTLDTSYSINSVNFSSGALAFNIAGNGNTLTVGTGGIIDNAANSEEISSRFIQSTDQTWNIAGGTFTLNGQLLNSAGGSLLTKTGAGTLVLTGLGTGSSIQAISLQGGATQISSGTLYLSLVAGNSFSLGAGTLTVDDGATLDGSANGSGTPQTVDGPAGPSLTISGSGTNAKFGFEFDVGYTGSDSGSLTVQQNAAVSVGTFLDVGTYGSSSGVLSIASGGTLTCPEACFGYSSGTSGTGTVTGSGSELNATDYLPIGGDGGEGGTGALTVSNGGTVVTPQVQLYTGGSLNVSGGTVVAGSLMSFATGDGAIVLTDPLGGTALTLNATSGTNTYSGTISGTGSIAKSGNSTQILAGNNTFTGLVDVFGGTLQMASGAASYYEVDGGTLQLGFTSLGSSVIYANAGANVICSSPTISGGYLEGPGTYNLAAVTTIAGTTIENGATITPAPSTFLRAVTSSGTILDPAGDAYSWYGGSNAGGNFTVSGTALLSEWTSSGITQVNAGGTINNIFGTNMVLLGGSRTYVGTAASPGGSITLSGGETIELNGGLLVNYGSISGGTVDVNFGGLATGTGTYGTVVVNPGGTYSPGVYGAASPAGQSATDIAAIQPAASGATSIATPLVLNADAVITVNGTDSLTLSGSVTTTGHAVTKLGSGAAAMLPFNATSLSVSSGTLKLSPSPGVLQIGTLTVASGATLDLGTDAADVSGGNLATINGLVKRGFNGAGWNGTGIDSSSAAAAPRHLMAVGVIQNNQNGAAVFSASNLFHGITPGAGDILLADTIYGDANLSGTVDGSDYTLIDHGFTAHLTGWLNGDFNYDGVVNGSDYTLIDNAFNTQNVGVGVVVADSASQVASTSPVPEPASLAIGLGAVALLSHRRRKRGK